MLITRLMYGSTRNLITLSPVEDAASQRLRVTYLNFGRSDDLALMSNLRKKIGKIWTVNLALTAAYCKSTSVETYGRFENSGFMLQANLNNSIAITQSLSAEVSAYYQSRARQAYIVMEPMANLSVGLRQQLLKNRMTLSLTANDLFNTTGEKGTVRYGNVNWTLDDTQDDRWVNLTLSWNFGSSTVKAARDRQTGIEDEVERAR